jgi:hypothetical protein
MGHYRVLPATTAKKFMSSVAFTIAKLPAWGCFTEGGPQMFLSSAYLGVRSPMSDQPLLAPLTRTFPWSTIWLATDERSSKDLREWIMTCFPRSERKNRHTLRLPSSSTDLSKGCSAGKLSWSSA